MAKEIDKNKRVVITGLGVISSIGIGWQEFWKNLIAGKSGITKISSFDTSMYDRHFGGEVKIFKPEEFIDLRKISKLGRASQMAIAATKLGLKDGTLNINKIDRSKMGVFIGTTTGEIQLLEHYNDYQYKQARDFLKETILVYPASSISTNVALEFKITNRNAVFATACAAGNYAVAYAYDQIRASKLDYAIAGGADALSRIVFTGFNRLLAVAPEKCQPFDKNRQGMIPGEGAGILLIESLASAQKRKAKIYAEILGYGLSCDAHHMTNPSSDGVSKAIKKALKNSNVDPGEIDYISAHGTGTIENDLAESQAVNRVFGKHGSRIPMSSIKSMLGHAMGAASAFETIACCLAIQNNEIPPTINVENQDPKCLINCVPNKSIKLKIETVLNNSQAFGGNNACIIIDTI